MRRAASRQQQRQQQQVSADLSAARLSATTVQTGGKARGRGMTPRAFVESRRKSKRSERERGSWFFFRRRALQRQYRRSLRRPLLLAVLALVAFAAPLSRVFTFRRRMKKEHEMMTMDEQPAAHDQKQELQGSSSRLIEDEVHVVRTKYLKVSTTNKY